MVLKTRSDLPIRLLVRLLVDHESGLVQSIGSEIGWIGIRPVEQIVRPTDRMNRSIPSKPDGLKNFTVSKWCHLMLLTSKRRCFGGYKNSKPLLLHLNFGEEAATPSTHPDTHTNSHRRSPRPIHRLPARSAASAQNPLQPSPPFFFHRVVSVSTIPHFFFPCRSPYCKAPSR